MRKKRKLNISKIGHKNYIHVCIYPIHPFLIQDKEVFNDTNILTIFYKTNILLVH